MTTNEPKKTALELLRDLAHRHTLYKAADRVFVDENTGYTRFVYNNFDAANETLRDAIIELAERIEALEAKTDQMKAAQMNAAQMNADQMKAAQMNADQMNAAGVNPMTWEQKRFIESRDKTFFDMYYGKWKPASERTSCLSYEPGKVGDWQTRNPLLDIAKKTIEARQEPTPTTIELPNEVLERLDEVLEKAFRWSWHEPNDIETWKDEDGSIASIRIAPVTFVRAKKGAQ